MDENRVPSGGTDDAGFGDNYISLTDENGEEIEFKVIDSLDLEEGSYVALETTPDDPVAYLNSDGSMVTGRKTIGGVRYYFNNYGALVN